MVLESARLEGWRVDGFFDDSPDASLDDLSHLGVIGSVESGARAILCVGDVVARRRLLDAVAWEHASVTHPSAILSEESAVGEGVFIGPRVVVNPRARVGAHAILNSGCIIEHDASVGPNSHVAPGSVVAGGVSIGADALLGIGCRVLPGVRIGDGCVVGAGSVVNRHIDDGERVAGVPAQSLS